MSRMTTNIIDWRERRYPKLLRYEWSVGRYPPKTLMDKDHPPICIFYMMGIRRLDFTRIVRMIRVFPKAIVIHRRN